MSALLERAFQSVRDLSPAEQDEVAHLLLRLVGLDDAVAQLSDAEARSFSESLGQADRGEFAADEEIRAIWAKHGL